MHHPTRRMSGSRLLSEADGKANEPDHVSGFNFGNAACRPRISASATRAHVKMDRREQVVSAPAGSGLPELLPYRGLASRAQLPTYRLADWHFGTSASVKPLSAGPRSGPSGTPGSARLRPSVTTASRSRLSTQRLQISLPLGLVPQFFGNGQIGVSITLKKHFHQRNLWMYL
jgi:hypothetical protein